jgi:hypothetical protein
MSGLEWGLIVLIGIGLVIVFFAIAAVISSDEEE